MSADARCGALVLAAGRGRRFGSDKRRALLPDGRTLLRATLDAYLPRTAPDLDAVCLVLGPDDPASELLGGRMDGAEHLVRAQQAHLGMGHSLAEGVAACRAWDAILIVLADMPWIRPETITALVAAWRGSSHAVTAVVRPCYQGRGGHPVCFGGAHFDALTECRGDQGAAALLRDCATLEQLQVEDPGVLMDADTPGALADALADVRT